MLKHVSVRSSNPQVRSQCALRSLPSGFQKAVNSLLEHIQLPFPTFQFVKAASQTFLEEKPFVGWLRPAQLKPSFLLLHETLPPVMIDSRDQSHKHTFRIPLGRKKLAAVGPVLCEVYWDPHEQTLWVVDVISWKHEAVYMTKPFTERAKLLATVVNEILYDTTGYSDSTVISPTFLSLEELSTMNIDSEFAVEFQPDTPGKRRFVFSVPRKQGVTQPQSQSQSQPRYQQNQKERLQNKCEIIDEPDEKTNTISHYQSQQPIKSSTTVKPIIQQQQKPVSKTERVVLKLVKDTRSKLPDTYRLFTDDSTEQDMGLAAIRNMTISFALKEVFRTQTSILVDAKWYDPFQKYEILGLKEN